MVDHVPGDVSWIWPVPKLWPVQRGIAFLSEFERCSMSGQATEVRDQFQQMFFISVITVSFHSRMSFSDSWGYMFCIALEVIYCDEAHPACVLLVLACAMYVTSFWHVPGPNSVTGPEVGWNVPTS